MNARFPDAGTIRTVLALASRAPSVHNTQPWRWLVGAESLHLYADAERQLPNTDPDGRDLIVSCGAALNHCVVALALLVAGQGGSPVIRDQSPCRDRIGSQPIPRYSANDEGPWGWDFGVLETATEALLSGFVRLYWPDQSCGGIDRKADRGGHDEVRIVCEAG